MRRKHPLTDIQKKQLYPLSNDEVLEHIRPFYRHPDVKGHYITRFIIASFIFFCSHIPWWFAAFLGDSMGFLGSLIGIRKKIALRNLDIAFKDTKTKQEKYRIYKDSMKNLGRVLVYYFRAPSLDLKFWNENCTWVNREILDKAFNRGKGVVILAGHFGMYDLAAGVIGCNGYPLLIVGKKIHNPVVNRFILEARQSFNAVTLHNKGTLRTILRSLKKGYAIGMVVDQDMPLTRGIMVDWFGHPASTIKSSAYMVKKTECAVVPVAFYQTGVKSFEIKVYDEVKWVSHAGSVEEELNRNTEEHCKALQQAILEKPECWFWIHKRYKTQEDPALNPYR
ncbi:MAG: hypothetical protein CR997_10470 [Acidobacteria bacterium]|nr:MAG: hypothetical protein CR997_10470 [Acidobacteriota bacterium]